MDKLHSSETDVASPEQVYWQRFSVPFDYPVAFTRGIFRTANPLLCDSLARVEARKRHRCLFFLDRGLCGAMPLLPDDIRTWSQANRDRVAVPEEPIQLPGGEELKRGMTHVEIVQEAIARNGVDRHSYVIAVGGGAFLDAVGFAAATAHRGVRHVRIPTTVLSQNDSGVGVKNAVNRDGVKNYTGTFAPPWAVLNDFDFLEALPRRERIAGIAEAVKVALIRSRDFYHWLEENAARLARFERRAEEHMIRRCAELHMHQIAQGGDPFETGSARPLDFGHWSAHKLEALTNHELRHGEAVAIGVALDTRYSVLAGHLEPGTDARVARLLSRLGFRLDHPALRARTANGRLAILAGLDEFREHLGGALTVTLLSEPGIGIEVHSIDPSLVAQAMDWLQAFEARTP